MKFPPFIARLSWKQVLIHFCAAWFFIYGFQTLSFLCDIELATVAYNNPGKYDTILLHDFDSVRIVNYLLWNVWSGTIGLLTALVISLIISKRRHWFWLNSLVVLLLAFFLRRYDMLGWNYLKNIFLAPGSFFKNNLAMNYLTNGLIMLSLGLVLFFTKRINDFIGKKEAPLPAEPIAAVGV